MKAGVRRILAFPCAAGSASRRAFRKNLLSMLRLSESAIIVDIPGCRGLDHQEVRLLLDCTAQAAGRGTELLFVAGSPVVRTLLDVIRISSLVPVFDSTEEALAYPWAPVAGELNESQAALSQLPWSA